MYANKILSHIMHTDPKTNSKVFADLDNIQYLNLKLNFLSVVWTRVPRVVSQMLWGERFGWFMFGERLHIRNLICFFQLYQGVCYLIILQNLTLPSTNAIGSLWTARNTTLLQTVCAAPKDLPHSRDPNSPCPPQFLHIER